MSDYVIFIVMIGPFYYFTGYLIKYVIKYLEILPLTVMIIYDIIMT